MTSREDKDWDDKVHAHCQAQIKKLMEDLARVNSYNTELNKHRNFDRKATDKAIMDLRATVTRLEGENEELRKAPWLYFGHTREEIKRALDVCEMKFGHGIPFTHAQSMEHLKRITLLERVREAAERMLMFCDECHGSGIRDNAFSGEVQKCPACGPLRDCIANAGPYLLTKGME